MSFPDTDFNDIYYKIRFESLQGVFPSITVFCHFYQKNKYFGFKYHLILKHVPEKFGLKICMMHFKICELLNKNTYPFSSAVIISI